MREFRYLKGPRVGRPLGLRGERRIFRVEPVQKSPRFVGSRRDHAHLRGRGKERNCRRVDHLEEIETERVQPGGSEDKSRDRRPAPARTFPPEEQTSGRLREARRAHCCGVVARATEVIPRSKAAFVTAITRSYEASRSALITIERPSRLVASSAGPSWSSVTF